jgi:hypothetical protein
MSFSGIAIRLVFVVVALLIWVILSRIAPPSHVYRNRFDELKKLYGWIARLASVAAVVGLLGSLLFFVHYKKNTFWMVGAVLGWAVIVPVLLIAVLTLPRGLSAWIEFWRFYELKYNLSLRLISALYLLLAFVGIISTVAFFNSK